MSLEVTCTEGVDYLPLIVLGFRVILVVIHKVYLFYLIDPYCIVSFGNRSQTTHIEYETLTPKWNETVICGNIKLYGYPDDIVQMTPPVVIELFDKDKIVSAFYNGLVVKFSFRVKIIWVWSSAPL